MIDLNLTRKNRSRFLFFVGMLMACIFTANAAEERLLYVFRAPKDRDGFRTLVPSIEVHDINREHKLIRVIPITVPNGTRPVGDIRGVMANVKTRKIYISHYGATARDSRHHPGWVLCIDMMTNKPVWHKSYHQSVDRGALSPDGKTIYMPNGETSGLTYWHVIDAATGNLKGKINHIRQSHNTICSADGRVFMQGFGAKDQRRYRSAEGFRAPEQRSLLVYDPSNGKRHLVGPFKETNRPFTINGKGSMVFMTVNDFVGFQVGDVATGKVIFTCAPPKSGPVSFTNGRQSKMNFKPAGDKGSTKCHGIAMTANEKYIFHVDNNHAGVHVWDVSGLPKQAPRWVKFLKGHSGGERGKNGKKLFSENGIYGQPAWISSSYDGRYLYPETGEIIDTVQLKHVGQLLGADGRYCHSRFMLEIVFNNGQPIRAGDQFGVGRVGEGKPSGGEVPPPPMVDPPAAPSSLSAVAKSTSQIDLRWNDRARNEERYQVERSTDGRNFSVIRTLGANSRSYSDTGLSASTRYYYRVIAGNAGGESGYSNTANITTKAAAIAKPAAATDLKLTVKSTSQIDLTWKDQSNVEEGFRIERSLDGKNFSQISRNPANDTTFSNVGLADGKKYFYRVIAFNKSGNAAPSNVASASTLVKLQAPAKPTGLVATAASSSRINLTWSDSSTVETGYRLQRSSDGKNFSTIATLGANVTKFANNGLSEKTKYFYRIQAFNSAGDSGFSNTTNATTLAAPDDKSPTAPSNLKLSSSARYAGDSAGLEWKASRDNVGVDHYKVYRNGSQIGKTIDTKWVDSNLKVGSHSYMVKAEDGSGNLSASSNTVTVKIEAPPVPKPEAPSNLALKVRSETQIDLAWKDNSKNEDGFRIQRASDGKTFSTIAQNNANDGTYSDSGLNDGKTYTYRVVAFNKSGESAASNISSATTPKELAKPAAPGNLTAVAASSSRINLAWSDNSAVEAGSKVEISTDGKSFSQVASLGANVTKYASTGLKQTAKYYYRVKAHNEAGESRYSNIAEATTLAVPDTKAPTAPGNLTLAPNAGIAGESASLSWNASRDNVAVDHYKIYRNGAQVGRSTATKWVDANLEAGSYTYNVKAEDTSGNLSDSSNSVTAKILPPPAPKPEVGSIAALVLVDAESDKDLARVSNGAVIDLAALPSRTINFRAVPTGPVASIKFVLNGAASHTQVENHAPYVGFGHHGNDYLPWTPAAGTYTLTLTPYEKDDAQGEAGESVSIQFRVVDDPAVVGFTLIDATTDKDVVVIKNGAVFSSATMPSSVNIRADVNNGSSIQTVRFDATGALNTVMVQSIAPYSLFDDANGDYRGYGLKRGIYTIKATPITSSGLGIAKTVTFEIR
jgi:hypothetical protein